MQPSITRKLSLPTLLLKLLDAAPFAAGLELLGAGSHAALLDLLGPAAAML